MYEVTERKYVSWQITPYFFPLLASAAISLAIALYAWLQRRNSAIVALIFLMFTIAIWSVGYALELGSNELQLKLFFTNIEYIGIALLPVAWLAFALEFSGHESWLSIKRLCLLVTMPVITMILVWTKNYHNLIYTDAWIDLSQGYPVLEIARGQWYWVNVAYSYALVFIATLMVIEAFIHSTKLYKRQASVLLIGALIPWAANLAYMAGWNPFPYLDTTPLAFLFTGLAATIGLFYFGLLDIMPVARNIVMENMSEGIIVLDDNNRILDMNSAALNMTGLNLNRSIGQPLANLLSLLSAPMENLLKSHSSNAEGRIEKEVFAVRDNRYYNFSVSPIYGMRGDLKARLLLIQDITSRKKAEIRLKESEETALTLLNAPLDAAYLLDENGKILALSEAGARSLGKDVERLKGTYAYDLFSPDVRQKRKESVEDVFRSGKPIEFEDVRDGRYFNNLILPIFNQEGKPTKVAIFANDITERKHAEEAIRESETKYRRLFENSPIGIVSADSKGNIIEVNDALIEILGSPSAEATKKINVLELPSLIDSGISASFRRCLESGMPMFSEHPYTSKWGKQVHLKLQLNPIFGPSGSIIGVQGAAEDNTKRKLAEDALRESKDYLDKIINSIGDPLFVEDRTHRITLVNDAACRLFGRFREDLIGKNASELFPSREMAEISRIKDEEVFRTGVETTSEETNTYADKTLTVLVKKTPYTDNAGNQFLVGITRDITDRKQAEDRIIASLKEKDVLLKEVHHRVKNNLQIISALLYLQSSYLTDEDIINIFRDCQNRIKSMALVHENLYRSKDFGKVDFNEYISQLISQLSQSYGDLEGKIDFKVNSENVYLNINTAIPCGMIINELVSNSFKHAFPDGRSGEVRIDLASEDDGFRLVVSDNGVGIKGDLNIKESKTLGFRLIDTLVKQIDGEMRLDTINGTRCEIHFKGLI